MTCDQKHAPTSALAAHTLAEALARGGEARRAAGLFRQAVSADGRLAELLDLEPATPAAAAAERAWIGRFEAVDCPLCHAPGGEPVWAGNLSSTRRCHGHLDPIRTWLRCEDCGLVRVDRPVPQAALQAWSEAEGAQRPSPPDPSEFGGQVVEEDRLVRRIREEGYGIAWARRGDHMPPQPRLLEVGTGWGGFLAAARWRGFAVTGLSEDPAVAAWARRSLDVDVRTGAVSTDLPAGPFDVVVLRTALDTLDDPIGTLARLGSALEVEGLLALSVHTLDHPVHRVRGYDDPLWTDPARRTWFDRQSLALAMLRCDLQPVGTWHDPEQPGASIVLARREAPEEE